MFKYNYSNEGFGLPAPCMDIKIKKIWDKENLQVNAELDTGADITSIPKDILKKIDIPAKGSEEITDYNGKKHKRKLYFICLEVNSKKFEQDVIETENDKILLGRDILNSFVLLLNGKRKFFQFL